MLIAVGIYSFIRFVWLTDTKKEFSFTNVNTEQYLDIYYNLEKSVILIIKDDTENKSEYEQLIQDCFDGKQINVYYYNITNLSEQELLDFEAITGVEANYELPMLVYTLKGQVYDFLQGYQQSHYIIDFITRNNIG